MIFFTLASSSSGNSYYLGTHHSGILIDCGISSKTIEKDLSEYSISPKDLKGILITHEHTDHVKGLKVFISKYDIPVFASEKVLSFLKNNQLVPNNTNLIPIDEKGYILENLLISPFPISHDSICGYGYSIITPSGEKIAICTDTGYLSNDAIEHLLGSKIVLLESNYEKGLLEISKYPYSLKRRIESSTGHLSNTDCSSVLPYLIKNKTKIIILAHLSKENNMPELAINTAISRLSLSGFTKGKDYIIDVAPRSEPSNIFEF